MTVLGSFLGDAHHHRVLTTAPPTSVRQVHAVADPEMPLSFPTAISSMTSLEQRLQWLEALLLGARSESASERRERCGRKGTAVQTCGGCTATDIKTNGDVCNGATHFPPTSSQTQPRGGTNALGDCGKTSCNVSGRHQQLSILFMYLVSRRFSTQETTENQQKPGK